MSDKIIDGYKLFFSYFNNISDDEMVKFGLENLISVPVDVAKTEWEKIKNKLFNNEELYIRGYGRDAKGTELYFNLYKDLFNNNNIKKDPTNNHWPTKLIEDWTKVSKKPTKKQLERNFSTIQNFQVSHIFGCTKNPLLFTAPWNIIILPKIMDPFTGHEASGTLKEKFSESLRCWACQKYSDLIIDYNNIVQKLVENNLEKSINRLELKSGGARINNFLERATVEWQAIEIK